MSPKVVPRVILAGVLISACALMPGCVFLSADSTYTGPQTLPDSIKQKFSYVRKGLDSKNSVLKQNKDYTVRRITFASNVNVTDTHDLVIDYYDLKRDRKTPVILVLPILGGKNEIAHLFADYFACHGLAAAIVHRQEKDKDTESIEQLNHVFRQIVLDHRQAIDWIEMQPDLDKRRIGVFGVSAGAIKGALVSALEPRISTTVLALAGGDLAGIITHSTEKSIAQKRNAILEQHGITRQDLYKTLRAEFKYDPLDFAQYQDARRTLLILACFDQVVPFSTGLALRNAIGNPETVIIPTGHYTSLLYLPVLQRMSLSFLRRKLQN